MREYSFPLPQILFLFLGLCPFYFLPSSWAFTSSRLLASFHDPPKLLCFQTLFLFLGPEEEKQLVASFFVTFALWDLKGDHWQESSCLLPQLSHHSQTSLLSRHGEPSLWQNSRAQSTHRMQGSRSLCSLFLNSFLDTLIVAALNVLLVIPGQSPQPSVALSFSLNLLFSG